jgi:acetolactate synthase small subunit
MTALAIYFFNIPGAMMRVLNCFTRRGLLIQGVWCAPVDNRHRAIVMVEAAPITMEQIVRELESTVGVNQVDQLDKTQAEFLSSVSAPVVSTENGATVIKVAGPPEEHRALLSWLGTAAAS